MSYKFEKLGYIILSDYRLVRILRVSVEYLACIDHDENYNTVKTYERSILLDVESNDFFTKVFKEDHHIGIYDPDLNIYRIFSKDGKRFNVKDQKGAIVVCG